MPSVYFHPHNKHSQWALTSHLTDKETEAENNVKKCLRPTASKQPSWDVNSPSCLTPSPLPPPSPWCLESGHLEYELLTSAAQAAPSWTGCCHLGNVRVVECRKHPHLRGRWRKRGLGRKQPSERAGENERKPKGKMNEAQSR